MENSLLSGIANDDDLYYTYYGRSIKQTAYLEVGCAAELFLKVVQEEGREMQGVEIMPLEACRKKNLRTRIATDF